MHVQVTRPLAVAQASLASAGEVPAGEVSTPAISNGARGAIRAGVSPLTDLSASQEERFDTQSLRELGRSVFGKISNFFSGPESEQLINRLNAMLARRGDGFEESNARGIFSINGLLELNASGAAMHSGISAFAQTFESLFSRVTESLQISGPGNSVIDAQKNTAGGLAHPSGSPVTAVTPQTANEPARSDIFQPSRTNPKFADVRRRPYEAPAPQQERPKNTLSGLLRRSLAQRLFSSLKSSYERRKNG